MGPFELSSSSTIYNITRDDYVDYVVTSTDNCIYNYSKIKGFNSWPFSVETSGWKDGNITSTDNCIYNYSKIKGFNSWTFSVETSGWKDGNITSLTTSSSSPTIWYSLPSSTKSTYFTLNSYHSNIYIPKLTTLEKFKNIVNFYRARINGVIKLTSEKRYEKRANNLLKELIGNEEHKIYLETGRLFVKGNRFDYVLHNGGLMQRIEKDKVVDMCVHLRDKNNFPKTDNVIAMMMSIKHEEERVLKIANDRKVKELPEVLPKAACM